MIRLLPASLLILTFITGTPLGAEIPQQPPVARSNPDADSCRPQPMCRDYVDEEDGLVAAPSPHALILRGKNGTGDNRDSKPQGQGQR